MAARINRNKEIKKLIVNFLNNLKEFWRDYFISWRSTGEWGRRRMGRVRTTKKRRI